MIYYSLPKIWLQQVTQCEYKFGFVEFAGFNLQNALECRYGASTMLVLAAEQEVNGFTLDTSIGEFILTHPHITIPQRGKIYSINEGNSEVWDEATTKYIAYCKSNIDGHNPYTLRYIGSIVESCVRSIETAI